MPPGKLSLFHGRQGAAAYGKNGVEVVVLDLARDFPSAFLANYPEFPDSCPRVYFPLLHKVLKVLIDSTNVFLEQLRHQSLAHPERFVGETALHPRASILGFVQQNLATPVFSIGWHCFSPPYRLRTSSVLNPFRQQTPSPDPKSLSLGKLNADD
jgi:hypothetical protein